MNYKNMMDFSGKSVLVTGGTGSIGREFANAFASCGANVIISDINESTAGDIVDACRSYSVKAKFVKCNLLDVRDIKRMVTECVTAFGKIDILCNHAGFNNRKPAIEYTEGEWDKLIGVDLKAVFFVAISVGKHMLENGIKGKIINTASVSAARGHKNLSIYASAKGGICQLTKVLANEWAESGINVNAVGPGYVITQQTQHYLNDPATRDSLLAHVPLKRFGKCSDIASTVLFLASEGASYITGQTIFVEGGRLID
ncbi:MAG: glucose 1-dehydrogenase [Synergistes jonesii]|uniref:SDR family NAD(P)-dependent oxidoreductase n=1 Tax=Synergistes jonesii TaxID=2754 RepID=UPI002A763F36|nr:glucose 1-dehydrogenase [Synergistes jonesii]MDY2984989.1 glucose 1-dehydrogenase [Synergistes jonesii]